MSICIIVKAMESCSAGSVKIRMEIVAKTNKFNLQNNFIMKRIKFCVCTPCFNIYDKILISR